MTVALRPPDARVNPGVRRELAWHAPAHALMLGVMVVAMVPGIGVGLHLAAIALLALLALGLAPFARRHPSAGPVLLDTGGMTVVLVACAMAGPAAGGHQHGIDGAVIAVLGGVGWLVGRLHCTAGAVATTTGALTGAGLVAMIALALV